MAVGPAPKLGSGLFSGTKSCSFSLCGSISNAFIFLYWKSLGLSAQTSQSTQKYNRGITCTNTAVFHIYDVLFSHNMKFFAYSY